jgi:hypothetical protein
MVVLCAALCGFFCDTLGRHNCHRFVTDAASDPYPGGRGATILIVALPRNIVSWVWYHRHRRIPANTAAPANDLIGKRRVTAPLGTGSMALGLTQSVRDVLGVFLVPIPRSSLYVAV